MNKQSRIYIAGHTGLVGSALMANLKGQNYSNLITRSFEELDLRNQHKVNLFMQKEQPEYIFLAAAKVGGIKANNEYPAEFIYDNIMIATNIIDAAYRFGVTKLLFLGSSCIYPRDCKQPIREEYLLEGPLEKTNEPYAIAKIAGITLCQSYNRQYGTNFISCMPTNLYGPHDNFDFENSHVIPALIAKMYNARMNQIEELLLWGTGKARREFLYSYDLAHALIFLMQNYNGSDPINIGSGVDISISDLAHSIKEIIEYKGNLIFNNTVSDGTPRKLLDSSRLTELGWTSQTSLKQGIVQTVEWYKKVIINPLTPLDKTLPALPFV